MDRDSTPDSPRPDLLSDLTPPPDVHLGSCRAPEVSVDAFTPQGAVKQAFGVGGGGGGCYVFLSLAHRSEL